MAGKKMTFNEQYYKLMMFLNLYDITDKFISNLHNCIGVSISEHVHNCNEMEVDALIDTSFPWESTPEGQHFWHGIYKKYCIFKPPNLIKQSDIDIIISI